MNMDGNTHTEKCHRYLSKEMGGSGVEITMKGMD